MISIGAQSNSNQISGNATSFSNYNKGLIDRVIPNKYSSEVKTGQPLTDIEKLNILVKYAIPFSILYSDTPEWDSNNIPTAVESLSTALSLSMGMLSSTNKAGDAQLPAPFFLPFNLQLTMDGLSGMTLYQKFKITEDVLPPSYEDDSVDIIIKGINHSITADAWITKLDTLSVPRPKKILPSTNIERTVIREIPTPDPVRGVFATTITSGIPMTEIFYKGPSNKTQIYLHHTAGRQNIRTDIESWNKRTDHVSTHYIVNNSGQVEQLYEDEAWGNHLGLPKETFFNRGLPYKDLNKSGLAIEMQAMGYLVKKNGKYVDRTGGIIPEDRVGRPVDKDGNYTTYREHDYYEKYSDAAIQNVRKILLKWMEKYDIKFEFDYDEMFPDENTLSLVALKGIKGIYTHNSVRKDKTDIYPQKEMIEMLKSISDSSSIAQIAQQQFVLSGFNKI
jgi:hypothetical protein